MTKDEALKLALEALQNPWKAGPDGVADAIIAIKEALAQPEPKCVAIVEVFGKDWRLDFMSLPVGKHKLYTQQYTYIASQKQNLVGWKLVPIEPTNEMLKAMDECSTEGYDERLLAGHASSVYMAAVDVSPTPPQRTWVGLTLDERIELAKDVDWPVGAYCEYAEKIEAKLRSKND